MKPSFIVTSTTKIIAVLVNIFAVMMFFKGHNDTGGGFIAGTISALSLIMLTMVYGKKYTKSLIKINPITLALSGVLLSYLTCLIPTFFDLPFMMHKLSYFGIGTPMIFDFGVYCVVVGTISQMIVMLEEAN